MTRNDKLRVYPVSCRSAYCGRKACDGCRHKPDLDAFQAWVQATNAVVADPVWCPTVYTASGD